MKTIQFLLLVCLLGVSSNSYSQITWSNKIRVHYQTASSQIIDNILIRFSADPTVTTDESFFWDARSLNCCTFIASMKGTTNLAIQTRPLNFVKDTVKLRVESTTWGDFKLVFTDFQNFSQAKQIWLLDAFTGTQQEVKTNTTYNFSITSNANSQGTERFKLVFVSEQLVIECPDNIVMNNTFGTNGATVLFSVYAPIAKCSDPIINFSHTPGSFFPIGNTTVNVDAYDLCGNTYSCSFIVTIKDIEPPTITTPMPLTYSTDAGTAFYNFTPAAPTTKDNSGSCTVTAVRNDAAALSAPYPIGSTIITWTATDAAGNQTSVSQLINITDTEEPVITAPAITMNAGSTCSMIITDYLVSVNDNSANVNYTGIRSDGADLNAPYFSGTTSVTWTATDASGNTTTAVQVITIEDKESPVIAPSNVVELTANANGCRFFVADAALDTKASDNCSGVILKNSITNTNTLQGVYLDAGNTTVTWTATDAAGNTSSYTQSLNVTTPSIDVSINDAAILTNGAQANTLYIGYTNASPLSYIASTVATGLTYTWTASTGLLITPTSDPATVNVSAASAASANAYQLSLTVTTETGCNFTFNKTINLVDIRCGAKLDKISVCSPTGAEACIKPNAITGYLKQGYKLGSCNINAKAVSQTAAVIKESTVNVFPNPANGLFQLQLNNYESQHAELKITDMMGKAVLQQSIKIQGTSEVVQINILHVPAGVYNASLITRDGIKVIRLVVAK